MARTYTFVFNPEPEGGYTVTCPALPGLVTHGQTIEEARAMARDAMEGLIEVMREKGETIPESDAPEAVPFDVRIPNKETRAALRELEDPKKRAALPSYTSVEELIEALSPKQARRKRVGKKV
jgi:predicted RNase H-like HicB family nuclease